MNLIIKLDICVDKTCFRLIKQNIGIVARSKWIVKKIKLRDFNTLKWNIEGLCGL